MGNLAIDQYFMYSIDGDLRNSAQDLHKRLTWPTSLASMYRMDAHKEYVQLEVPPPPVSAGFGRVWWAIGALVAVVLTALAFGAYRQPELLLNLMGLRYCG